MMAESKRFAELQKNVPDKRLRDLCVFFAVVFDEAIKISTGIIIKIELSCARMYDCLMEFDNSVMSGKNMAENLFFEKIVSRATLHLADT